jgi:heme-degrading monooxygenase HmoA
MFARFLEMTIQPDKKTEFTKKVKDEILPILKTYKGFFDLIHLEVETEFAKFYSISLWHDKAEMEKYTKENFPKVKAILEPFLTAPVIVKPCVVDETITKKFIAVAA